MRDGDQLRAGTDGVEDGFGRKVATRVGFDPPENHALPFPQEVPRNDVGMVLHDAQDDLVPGNHARRGPGIGDQVYSLGRSGREENLVLMRGTQKPAYHPPHALVVLGCQIGQEVQSAVDVRILVRVGARNGVDHDLRLLRRGAVVEIDQGLAVDPAREYREISPDSLYVVHSRHLLRHDSERRHQERDDHRQHEHCSDDPGADGKKTCENHALPSRS